MVATPLQNRKYLCQAPRPEVWGDISEAVLSNLGATAVTQLTDTVRKIRARHDLQPRTGPGRKSNAEHALQFYEHLLQIAKTNPPVVAPAAAVVAATVNEAESEANATATTEINDTKLPAADEVDDDIVLDGESISMDTPTFNAQHNDICEVCDEAGELLMCSTCNLVFHLECVRPKMEAMPDDPHWRCSHCILQSNPKKHSKSRRQAAAAVRLMARLRKQHGRRVQANLDAEAASALLGELEQPDPTEEETKPAAVERSTETQPIPDEPIAMASEDTIPDEPTVETSEETIPVEPTIAMKSAETVPDEAVIPIEAILPVKAILPVEPTAPDEPTMPVETILPAEPTIPVEAPMADTESIPVEPPLPPPEPVVVKRKVGRPPKKKKLPSEIAISVVNQPVELRSSPTRRAKALALELKTPVGPPLLGDHADQPSDELAEAMGQKRAASEMETASTASPDLLSPDSRSKRCRKQPTLYDPQRGPASRWQTDELKEWKASTRDDEEGVKTEPLLGVTTVTEVPKSARKAAREMGDGIWCGFCKDEADVPICVFCACRVCFGKHNQTQLLLCDMCDEEYHTFCLDPPLTTVPDAKQPWYCPSCKAATKAESPRMGRRTVVERISVRSKSREPVAAPLASTTTTRSTRTPPASPKKAATAPAPPEPKKVIPEKRPVGRPRGRPPKNPPVVVTVQPVTVTRKRDRSPKAGRSVSEPPRKRGRPPSAATIAKRLKAEIEARKAAKLAAKANSKANAAIKKAESVTFQDTKAAAPVEPVAEPVPPVAVATVVAATGGTAPVTISRSGRMVRRSSFHDERHEGAQHLKSGRSPSDATLAQGSSDVPTDSKVAAVSGAAASLGPVGRGQAIVPDDETDDFDDTDREYTETIKKSDSNSAVQSLKQPPLSTNDSTFLPIGTGETSSVASRPDSATAMFESDAGGMYSASNESSYRDKQPRRKPGARECMQISRRFGVKEIPQHYIDTLKDYCTRGKVEHLIRMRERLDEHSRFLESQLAGLEALVLEHGESDVVVPLAPPSPDRRHE